MSASNSLFYTPTKRPDSMFSFLEDSIVSVSEIAPRDKDHVDDTYLVKNSNITKHSPNKLKTQRTLDTD